MTVPQIFIGATHVGGCDELHALERAGKLDPLLGRGDALANWTGPAHEHGQGATFTRRTGADALGPLAGGQSRRRREADRQAKNGGADYVQTPEMTNIMEVKREQLFAAIVPEESDASLAAFRELARKLGIYPPHRLARHQALAGQSGQPRRS